MYKSIHSDQQQKLQNLLRKIRKETGLRQVDLANRLGQHQSFVSKYESGERRLDLVELKQVCDSLGVSLQDFIFMFEETIK